ncbi:alpha-2,8-polysialyltransferase family protein [Streptomyces tubbatahanensis]|uniref:Alpha-2,8-polysialyltransferase family protein n=1 Tax=Streptomyces tubbatahanensis TaxID=2923272 RepID=A0ABY3XLV4_9ACTN|nr:alpha-2,8-polysialyltransferase family protein [Streptomyces tubbatahanensis]UNS95393.1 alpha-2,8-polysialyltransferase family protein [Streptomyces tubbatahanensis]
MSTSPRHTRDNRALRPVQLFEVSTLYGAATLAASLDAGQFGPREAARRILLVTTNAPTPEAATGLTAMTGFDRLAERFDETIDWNEAIRPFHPSTWAPLRDESPVWERMFRHTWRLGDAPVELVVESVHVSPAKALATIFSGSAVHVYADGLMSYGPTRERLPQWLGCRIQRLLHLDLVPGLRPLLLAEHAVRPETVPTDAFRAVLGELGEAAAGLPELAGVAAEGPSAVLLGQYLAALGILSPEEEEQLHVRMLRGAVAAGHECLVFKPHPTAPARYSHVLEKTAAQAGVRLHVLDSPVLAETVYERCRPNLVVGCFSTAMLTAATCYGIGIARVGTTPLLDRLTPYQNSNRVPVTLVDFLVPDLEGGAAADAEHTPVTGQRTYAPGTGERTDALAALLRTVGYCMQAKLHPLLREEAIAWLDARLDENTERYFKRRRLTALALPGGGTSVRARLLRGSPSARWAARRIRTAQRALR